MCVETRWGLNRHIQVLAGCLSSRDRVAIFHARSNEGERKKKPQRAFPPLCGSAGSVVHYPAFEPEMMEKTALAAPQWPALFRRYNQSGRGTWTRCQEVSGHTQVLGLRTLDRRPISGGCVCVWEGGVVWKLVFGLQRNLYTKTNILWLWLRGNVFS